MRDQWIHKGVRISVDDDSAAGYEKIGPTRGVLNLLIIPLINLLPSILGGFVKKTHRGAEIVINKATTHEALEVLYSGGHPHLTSNWAEAIAHKLWFSTINAKAARNRLRLVKKIIRNTAKKLVKQDVNIGLLSIASGSARAVIEAMSRLKIPKKLRVSVIFLDKNPEAIEYSKSLAMICPKQFRLRWIVDTASNFPAHLTHKDKINIVEMVGLLDYFDDLQVVKVLSVIYNSLENGGVMIIANIDDNIERRFVTNLVNWKMIYRSTEELIDLALKSGFQPNKMRAIYEPLRIHHVLVAKK
ncbi:MAG: class I SAM-dependent methyltransferase [Candidatus Vogelbacteria bacterium]|nr:class I SAM-dependent methyltransferase [Candidatus Vogelbacteria bacterium]